MFGYRGFSRRPTGRNHNFTTRASSQLVDHLVRASSRIAPLVGGAVLGGGTIAYASKRGQETSQKEPSAELELEWVKGLAAKYSECGHSGSLLRDNPVGRTVFDDDHLFDSLIEAGMVSQYRGFYDKQNREFYAVVSLGPKTAGYPNTTHGGMTAAILDESFGGLGGSLWKSGGLGFRPPAYTARLEIDYKKKIPSGSTILVSTRVESMEDRKIWMTAEVGDGERSTVYATGRALFIAPRISSFFSWIPGLGRLGVSKQK